MDKEIRVLLVEDSAADAELVARELVKKDLAHISKLVQSKDEFLKALGEFAPDIVLCDYKLPRFGAPEALEILKKSYPETPLIVVSGTIGEDIAVDTMKLGAVDYIMKDRLVRLVPAIRRALEEARIASERKQAEEALQESEERYKNLFKANIDGILIVDVTTKKFRYANPAICRMLGYSEEELTRMCVADIHPKDSLEQVIAEFEAQISGAKITADVPCVRKDGQIISVSINAGTVMIDHQTKYLMGIFRDITDRKKAEELLKQAKTQAEAANEAKNQFLANMSHEMRTPLNAIIGFSKILMQEELAEEHKEHLKMIYDSGTHLLGLINDILNISSIETSKINIKMNQCSLGQVIANIESMIQPFAMGKGLTFEIREKGDLPANIVTDGVRLQQCLTNLVNNAIKFTEQGHIYVNISLKDKDSKPRIRFEVEDTGIGITPEFQQKVFEPFVQEDEGTSRKYGGTGLGLAIARKLAGLLGGELTLTSEKGKGSVFSFIIPAGVDLAAQPLLNRHKVIDDASKVRENRFSGCILVAEDVKTNQMLMKFLLEKMGLKVTIAENGAEAVDKALGQKFDLIFMDIQMPKVNGYEATRTLRSKGIKIPIVALTAGTMEGDEEKCIEAGCDVYLSKPIVISKLIETLSKYLPSENQVLIEAASSASSKVE
ncbi:MAG: response regulator [Sedimentisphaerales bacterium]